MARRKASFTFNWFWILLLIGGYNMFFDNDDKKSEVEVVTQDDRPAIEESVKEVVTVLGNEAKNFINDVKKEFENKKKGDDETPVPEPPPKEIMTAKPDQGPDPRPLNAEPESTGGFKKL